MFDLFDAARQARIQEYNLALMVGYSPEDADELAYIAFDRVYDNAHFHKEN